MDLLNRRRFLRAASGLFVPALLLRSKADIGIMPGPIMRPIAGSASTLNTNLACYWKMDESSAGSSAVTRADSVGGQNLTDNSPFAASATGIISNAVQLVAANAEFLSAADSATLSMGDIDFTIVAWLYLDTKPTIAWAVTKYLSTGNNREYALLYVGGATDRFQFRVTSDGASGTIVTVNADALGSPSTATWYQVICGHDSVNNLIFIYVNNGAGNTTATSAGVKDGTAAFKIGNFDNGSATDYWNGRVDEVGLWKNKVLSSTERTEIYNGGAGKTYPF